MHIWDLACHTDTSNVKWWFNYYHAKITVIGKMCAVIAEICTTPVDHDQTISLIIPTCTIMKEINYISVLLSETSIEKFCAFYGNMYMHFWPCQKIIPCFFDADMICWGNKTKQCWHEAIKVTHISGSWGLLLWICYSLQWHQTMFHTA